MSRPAVCLDCSQAATEAKQLEDLLFEKGSVFLEVLQEGGVSEEEREEGVENGTVASAAAPVRRVRPRRPAYGRRNNALEVEHLQ